MDSNLSRKAFSVDSNLSRKAFSVDSNLGRKQEMRTVSWEANYDIQSRQEVKIGKQIYTLWVECCHMMWGV